MKYKILLVEDERNFACVLRDYLVMNNFIVTWCEDGQSGLDTYLNSDFDLCLLDVMMPKKDGFTLAAEIKAHNKLIPILFLTAKSLRDDILKGYKIGVDDYITKPFDTELLLFKIKAILNRTNNNIQETKTLHAIGSLNFNFKLRTIFYPNGEIIKLSPKESELLHLLCQHQNDVLPREKALKQIWKDDTYFNGRSMDVYIAKLRKHLQYDKNIELTNQHGNGYCLMNK